MRYPQAYVLLDQQFEMPPETTVQKWTSCKSPVYIQGVSKTNKSLDERIAAIKQIHEYLGSNTYSNDQVVVLNGKKIHNFLIIATGSYLQKVYWIDSASHAISILRVNYAMEKAILFDEHIHGAYDAYWKVSKFISKHTGDQPFRDEQIDRLFQSRMWGDRSTAEHHLKRIAKNETRAGIMNRLDL